MPKTIVVDDVLAQRRVDIVVNKLLPNLSRSYIKKLFAADKIKLDDKVIKAGHKLRFGQRLTVDFDETTATVIPKIKLPILYEDDDVLIINKPVGVISHSRGKYWYEPSVASFVRQKTSQVGERAGIVHRLDRATSGVMICAKNSGILSYLQKQFANRSVKKSYLAIVNGHIDPPEAIIDMPIERNPKAPSTFRVGPNGKSAVTHYQVLQQGPEHDLLALTPTTGRTHQLRVHLQKLGHPIVGDELYGGATAIRLMLHAHRLEITLPNQQRVAFVAPRPREFATYLK